uniref:AlNc14C101G6028 protein n=1 Tax=Albugo laibachii Nc14 TaxID=890382 RepID=F0WHG5_9STRA|nr:AlNc14C101G6028 [Albugo laibachii Nc14]|eukprot:CCA20684.1 AlNc14C101G6028 [Albugo laibachii Nc14]
MAVINEEATVNADMEGQVGTLMQFHRRMAHLSYDTIDRMAEGPRSEIQFSEKNREIYLDFAQDLCGTSGSQQDEKYLAEIQAVTRSITKASVTDGQQKEIAQEVVNHIVKRDPDNYGEAMRSSKAVECSKTMKEDIYALLYLVVFEAIIRRRCSNALHSKWVFKTETAAEGRVKRFKARLVACGTLQNIWGVPAQQDDEPIAHAQADKEIGLDIFLHVPAGMEFELLELQ